MVKIVCKKSDATNRRNKRKMEKYKSGNEFVTRIMDMTTDFEPSKSGELIKNENLLETVILAREINEKSVSIDMISERRKVNKQKHISPIILENNKIKTENVSEILNSPDIFVRKAAKKRKQF